MLYSTHLIFSLLLVSSFVLLAENAPQNSVPRKHFNITPLYTCDYEPETVEGMRARIRREQLQSKYIKKAIENEIFNDLEIEEITLIFIRPCKETQIQVYFLSNETGHLKNVESKTIQFIGEPGCDSAEMARVLKTFMIRKGWKCIHFSIKTFREKDRKKEKLNNSTTFIFND